MIGEAAAPPRAQKAGWLRSLRRGLRFLQMARQVARARWQLRACDRVPLSVRLRGRVKVENYGRIEIGEKVRIEGVMLPVEMVAWPGAKLVIGAGTYLNYGVSFSAHRELLIGENCLIGNYAVVMDGDYHDLFDHRLPGKSAPVIIEDDVWLGLRVTVLKGVRIGRGSVIGAGSVVTEDIPPYSLAFGVPAKVIKALKP